MAVDFTTPISWLKSLDCKIEGTSKKCRRIFETFMEEVKEVKTRIANRLHKKKNKALVEDAIIEGSSEVIRGEI